MLKINNLSANVENKYILKGFSLAMIFGVVFGTYSSIYIANTVLVRLKVSQRTILREDEKN